MRWIKDKDQFLLTRDELANLVLFNEAWAMEPRKVRPSGFTKFREGVLGKASQVLLLYLQKCSKCGWNPRTIELNKTPRDKIFNKYGHVGCACDNPKLKTLLDESVRIG